MGVKWKDRNAMSVKQFRPEFARTTPRREPLPEPDSIVFAEEIPPCRAFVPGLGPCVLSRHGDEIEHTVNVEEQ